MLLLLVALLAIGASAIFLVGVTGRASRDVATTSQTSPDYSLPTPAGTVPATVSQPVHRALHTLERTCARGDGTERTARARPPLEVILDFARRNPDVSFPIHDETGTTLSLLFVARASLGSCAPGLVPRVERLIPAKYLAPNGPDT